MTILFAALFAAATTAQTPELLLPHHKPGLWKADIVAPDKTTSLQECLDIAFETQMEKIDRDKCTDRRTLHNADGSWTTSATCKIMLFLKISTRSEISGDFQSKLKIVSYKLPDNTLQNTTTETWTGPCKPDQKPGDIVMPSGIKINLLDVLGH